MDTVSEINKAISLSKAGEYKKAEKLYKAVLKQDKNNQMAMSCLGWMYYGVGEYNKAEKLLEQSYEMNQKETVAECLAFVKKFLQKDYEVIKYCDKIPVEKKSDKLLELEIFTLIDLKYVNKAKKLAQYYYDKRPLIKESLYTYAFSLVAAGDFDNAENVVKQLMKFFPKYGRTWYVAGLVYEILYHRDDLAFECYKKQLKTGDKGAYWNMAISVFKQKKYKKTQYYLRKLKEFEGIGEKYNFLKAWCYFTQRNFKKGYKFYVKKLNWVLREEGYLKFLPPHKSWNGAKCSNNTLLVYDDQGAGDAIMFCRYLTLLKKKFKKIKIILKSNMIKLYTQSGILDDAFEVFGKNNLLKSQLYKIKYDKYAFLSDLPYYLKTDIDSIPHPEGYLSADEEKVKEYKEKYFKTDKLKVGLCWEAGGSSWREQLNRTLHISVFDKILNLKDIEYYSLQKEPLFNVFNEYRIADVGSSFETFDDTAAAIMNLDLVITVDTSVAHLAGALGKKTFLLLPYITDWRWFNDTETTPWYNSVKIFKQDTPQSWDNVLKRIEEDLNKLINNS